MDPSEEARSSSLGGEVIVDLPRGVFGTDDGDQNPSTGKNNESSGKSPFYSSSGGRAIYDMSSAQSSSWADDDESYSRLMHIASDVTLLGGVLGSDTTTPLEEVVGTYLHQGTFVGITIWVTLLAVMVGVAPAESYQYMNRTEQISNAVLFTLLLGFNINQLGPLFVNDRNWKFLKSGAMGACFTVQFIAVASAAAMLLLPTPVIVDPSTGMRCHMVRWASWTALGFLMTFLTEAIDLPLEGGETGNASWTVGIMIALATLSGGLFPFCPNMTTWVMTFGCSWMLFSILPIRMVQKLNQLKNTPEGDTMLEKESYERLRFSVKLHVICTVLWTFLALSFSGCCLASKYASPDSLWKDEAIVLVVENCFEALSKVVYLSILMEIHRHLFDDLAKKARRLQELCDCMSAVWDISSDVVIICSKNDHLVTAAVSPAIFQFGDTQFSMAQKTTENPITLVMEIDPYEGYFNTFEVDLSEPLTASQVHKMLKDSQTKVRDGTPVFQKNLKVLADLVGDACAYAIPAGRNQHVLTKNFYHIENNEMQLGMSCEAKIANLKGKALLIILRNMTPKFKLVKAEMQIERLNRKLAAKS